VAEKEKGKTLEDLNEEGQRALQMVIEFSRQAGRAETAFANENINKFARLKALRTIQEQELYKYLPGGKTMRDALKLMGYSKTTGYEDLKTLEMLGDRTVELLMGLGVSSKDSYLLAKSLDEVEDAEFEVLDKEKGEFKIGGKVVTMDADRGLISSALLEQAERARVERQARQKIERDYAEKSEENQMLREKVFNGENKYTRLKADAQRRERGLLEESKGEFGNLVMNLVLIVNTMEKTELTEEEQKLAERYLDLIECKALQRVYEKLKVYLPKKEWED
jgi:hypothetical protein